MATGYGIYSETTYANNGLNMAVAASLWRKALEDTCGTILRTLPDSWTGLTKEGDDYDQLKNIVLIGYNSSNTDAGRIYWLIMAAEGSVYTIQGFKGAYGSSDLVVEGTRTGNGSVTLSAKNSSGLTGSLTLAFTVATSGIETVQRSADMALELLRSGSTNSAFYEVSTALVEKNPHFTVKKMEYLRQLHDKSQLFMAEVYAGLMLFFRQHFAGRPSDSFSEMMRHYERLFKQELSRSLQWDSTISVTEDTPETSQVPTQQAVVYW